MSQILDFYNQQGGAALSKMVNEMAPFFASIDSEFSDLRKSYSEVKMQNQKKDDDNFEVERLGKLRKSLGIIVDIANAACHVVDDQIHDMFEKEDKKNKLK